MIAKTSEPIETAEGVLGFGDLELPPHKLYETLDRIEYLEDMRDELISHCAVGNLLRFSTLEEGIVVRSLDVAIQMMKRGMGKTHATKTL